MMTVDTSKATELLNQAAEGKTADARSDAAKQLISVIKSDGLSVFKGVSFEKILMASLTKGGKTGAEVRLGAANCVEKLARELGPLIEALLIPLLPEIINLMGDKLRNVAVAATSAGKAIIDIVNPNAVKPVIQLLLVASPRWQSMVFRLDSVRELAARAPLQVVRCMPDVVPFLTSYMWDLKSEVKVAAKAAVETVCKAVDNKDIQPFIPNLIKAIENPTEVAETVHLLAGTTFVQVVEAGALSIMCPLLIRGFGERGNTASIRQCARIVENMAKLVDEPTDIAVFLPKLLPLLDNAKESVSDPECREVCSKAHELLCRKGDLSNVHQAKLSDVASVLVVLKKACNEPTDAIYLQVLEYLCSIVLMLKEIKVFEAKAWYAAMVPCLSAFVDVATAQKYVDALLTEVLKDITPEAEEEDDADIEELCNCVFRLAYGSKILLNNTNLKLKRGYRYGLVGQNDSGKTSLMRAIANQKIDGFPSPDELRTVFVETDIQGELSDLSVLEYVYADELLKNCGVPQDEMATVLNSVGFVDGSPANITTPVGALSGGWKMKLALARAMLLRADILLLDEPTNHLDVHNVKWVENYLNGLKGVTCIMVSHDSGFLDRVCTHIIEIRDLKLHIHKGNLSEFVKNRPDTKSYFELKSSKQKFSFPQPGTLEGINTKGKPIMKMTDITFTYPGASKPQLHNVTVRCSLSSRVACVGVNGAGKSTMIKLLTGELEPDAGSGEVWKHPNCRVAYVAQHAFHHIENHLSKTANEYIRWRYEHGKDREGLEKVTVKVTPEEEKMMAQPITCEYTDPATGAIKREKRVVRRLTEGRRQQKKLIEYEVDWVGHTESTWVDMEYLIANGWEKMLKICDEAIAMRASAYARPLTIANVEKHLEDVGLDREFGTHTRIQALSGGQKVKVVLAAAMWNCPHLLILDEPTNYLDRDSLGALAGAIREFEGGVVMITHNNEFCSSLCPEVWLLENNRLNLKGDPEWMENVMKEKIVAKEMDVDMKDKFGNDVKLAKKKPEALSRAQKKKLEKEKKMRKAMGIVDDSDDDF